ncbi:ShlB/FhaC/HecB family hemolysin secretion/activation protein [Oxalobacteraceae bacterium A2-2]
MKNLLRPLCAQAGLLLVCGQAAQAQVLDAGRALRESEAAARQPAVPGPDPALAMPAASAASQAARTATPAAAQPTFTLTAIAFRGNTVFADAVLQQLVADKLGQRVSFAELAGLAERVSAHYRAAGYLFSEAFVPAQEIEGGKVEISVLEGRLARVRIEHIDDAPVAESRIAAIAAQLPTDRPLTQQELERVMLILSDTPGMATQAALEAGDAPGTFDLVIEVKPAPRSTITADLDNQGTASTGRYRAGLLARYNSPLGIGDNLDLRLLNSLGKGLLFGRLAYELPLGPGGLRASAALGRIQYQLGADFDALDAHGSADVLELAATYPLLRSRMQNLFGKLSLEYKRLDDHIDAVGTASTKYLANLDLGMVYERRDQYWGGGYVSGGFDLYRGHLDIRSPQERALDQGPAGRHTNGSYVRLTYQASRLQYVSRALSAYLAVAGQWANRNLDSADKIATGGARAVRAFSSSGGIGDHSTLLNAELRWSVSGSTTFSAFYDIGRVRVNHAPAAGEANRLTLGGPGLGLFRVVATGVTLRASVAWPTLQSGTPESGREHGARVFGQLVKAF